MHFHTENVLYYQNSEPVQPSFEKTLIKQKYNIKLESGLRF